MSQACSPADVQRLLKDQWPPAVGSVSARIRQAAHDLGWDYARIWNYWYGKVRRVEGHEALWADAMKRRQERTQRTAVDLREEHDDITVRHDRMEALLATLVSGLAGEALPEVQSVLRESRGAVGSRDVRG